MDKHVAVTVELRIQWVALYLRVISELVFLYANGRSILAYVYLK